MIKIIDFENVEINGINVGDCFAAYNNYPEQALDILSALSDYDRNRQANTEPIVTIDPRVTTLEQQLSVAQSQISSLEQQLSQYVIRDWPGLISELRKVGFYDWLTECHVIDPDLIDDTGRLSIAANQGDRLGVITEYQTLYAANKPSEDYRAAWQGVLDRLGIPSNLLYFAS